MINAVIFSYKNKHLKSVVDELIANTKNSIFIWVIDQHNLNREVLFSDLSYKDKVSYRHVYWDQISSPVAYKAKIAQESSSEYFLSISDDVIVSKDWDEQAISFLKNKEAVVSGMGSLSLGKENLFFFKQNRSASPSFIESAFIDRNFIFGKTNTFKDSFSTDIKYRGEEELSSLFLYNLGVKIFASPSGLYQDLNNRTIENKYVPFSLDHNYNLAIQQYRNAPPGFLALHGINTDELYELPYPTNDVLYDPYSLDFQNVDGKKFLQNINSIS
jgi:hypothetical protein